MENNPEIHFMLDLETLDTKPSTHILELALVCFDPFTGRVNEKLSRHEKFGFAPQPGATISPSTVAWWIGENKEYFTELLTHNCESDKQLRHVLFDIDIMLSNIRVGGRGVCLWNTGNFDVDIINDAARRVLGKTETLFKYWEIRDVRAMYQVKRDFGLGGDDEWPTSHNAKDDCLRQISYVQSVYGALSERRTESAGDPRGRADVPASEEHATNEDACQQTSIPE